MAGRSLPAGNRSRTSLDQDKENFEKYQTIAISKAINEIEVPLKAKHVRSAIIGTFQEKSSTTFWSIVLRLPLHGNPIIAWKFYHTLHKLLREGHPNVLKDACKHMEFLVDNGKLWGHLKEGYGKLIYLYCRILTVKLDFHRRNPKFPGNLLITDEDLELACENDVNLYFQLSVELLDYMDEILNLQLAVFGSLDMSRSNSMTNAGQCRLAPLIPCIQDSSQIYDYIVKLLFKLHSCLPPDTLEGHRLRFLKQFKALRQFYLQSSTLQYFKTLIQVPYLDENPPNFLVSSELSRHVTPVVILPPEPPAPDVSLVELGDTDTCDINGSSSPDLLAERDRYIQHLLHQIEQLSSELKRIRAEYQRQDADMQHSLKECQLRLAEKEADVEDALRGKEEIEQKLAEAAQSAQLGSLVQLQLQEVGKKAKGWEEKFVKLKEVYQKLRDEHIALIRQKADADKKLLVAEAAVEDVTKVRAELHDALELTKTSAKDFEAQLDSMKKSQNIQIKELSSENQELCESKNNLKALLANAEHCIEKTNSEITLALQEKEHLFILAEENKSTLLDSERRCSELQNSLDQALSEAQKSSMDFISFKAEMEVKVLDLIKEKEEVTSSRSDMEAKVQELERDAQEMASSLTSLQQEKIGLISQLNNLKGAIELSNTNAQNFQIALEETKSKLSNEVEELNIRNKVALALEEEKKQLIVSNNVLQENVSNLEKKLAKAIYERNEISDAKDLIELKSKENEEKFNQELNTNKLEYMRLLQRLIVDCAVKAEQYLNGCVADFSNPPVVAMTIIEHNGVSAQSSLAQLELLSQTLDSFLSHKSDETIACVIPLIFPLAQSVGYFLLQGQQLAHSLPDLVAADQLLAKFALTGNAVVDLNRILQKQLNSDEIHDIFYKVRVLLQETDSLAEAAVERMKAATDRENVVDLENELGAMERAIEEASDRIAKMWDTSKRSETGLKLEVNEKVLDSCTALMKAIIELIRNAKILQEEIVSRSKGSATAKEFYKRNHRWSEGLLSAAKAVGFGAKLLTDAADKVVQGQAKFEQLTVASQEIAASTAQLVFASRVKAELQSKNLQSLAEASKAVSSATGGVVATAKLCAQLVEDSTVLDFSNLTLHQAKRLEMESQVKVLEFESSLEKERLKLSALRRQHYQLAGEMDS